MPTRSEKLLAHINPATQTGVEIGPLMRPTVTREMGEIRYVDHATTEELQAKYAQSSLIDVNQIVKIDYVWGKQPLTESMQRELPFDYIVASHVIEHVPDLIGWLKELHSILKPSGILTLAIPDQRYCFDYYRLPTTMADIVDAYLRRARKPAPRNIFDHHTSAVAWHNSIIWATAPQESELTPVHSELQAWEAACRSVQEDCYIDVHCWVFTPHSFFNLLRGLINLQLLDFTVKQFFTTEGCEFFVSLEALDPALDSRERQQIQFDSLPMSPSVKDCRPSQYLNVYRQVEELTNQLELAQNQLAAAQQAIQEIRKQESESTCYSA